MQDPWSHPDRIEPVRVLRVRLHGPVTLGHVLLLDEIGSPVVSGPFSIGDLALAVLVCSEPSATQARKSLRSWWAKPLLSFWGRMCGREDMTKDAEVFAQWFAEQCGGPAQNVVLKQGKAPPKPLAAPWYMNKLALAVGELGLSIAEAEALPLKRLNQITAALAEARGQAEFESAEEREFFEQVKRWDAEKAGRN